MVEKELIYSNGYQPWTGTESQWKVLGENCIMITYITMSGFCLDIDCSIDRVLGCRYRLNLHFSMICRSISMIIILV